MIELRSKRIFKIMRNRFLHELRKTKTKNRNPVDFWIVSHVTGNYWFSDKITGFQNSNHTIFFNLWESMLVRLFDPHLLYQPVCFKTHSTLLFYHFTHNYLLLQNICKFSCIWYNFKDVTDRSRPKNTNHANISRINSNTKK